MDEAGDRKTLGITTQWHGVRREVDGLKGTSGSGADGQAVSGYGGGRGRLGGINDDDIISTN